MCPQNVLTGARALMQNESRTNIAAPSSGFIVHFMNERDAFRIIFHTGNDIRSKSLPPCRGREI
jgi:hypothetical protein